MLRDRPDHTTVYAQRSPIDGRRERAADEGHCHRNFLRRREALDDRTWPGVAEKLALEGFTIGALIFRQLLHELDDTFRRGWPGQHSVDCDRATGGSFSEAA